MKYILLSITFFLASQSLVLAQSTCFGSTSSGHLEKGVQLPASGRNYVGYSVVARLAGRTYVHSEVNKIIVAAYKQLESEQPNKVYKYAETGYEEGGQFKPHKTHRNGLSVDFMTPVMEPNGISVHLPTNPLNRFGYDIEFDKKNQFEGLSIDFEAMSAHLVALHQSAIKNGYNLRRVIFDPKLQVYLFETSNKNYLKKNITFSKRPSWVRHDEHYHVDFLIPCK